jgi:hypothetical protein
VKIWAMKEFIGGVSDLFKQTSLFGENKKNKNRVHVYNHAILEK